MKKRSLLLSTLLFSAVAFAQQVTKVTDPVEWINPLMGTQSKYDLSNGNTYPAIALPWGMNFWTPQTGKMGDGWQYTYDSYKINGFKQTHQPSPWMNDYGQFAIMPVTGKIKVSQNQRQSWFSHKAEIAKPYYYSVYLADHDVTTEIAPTERSAQFRFTYPKTDSSYIVIDAFDKGSYIKIIPGEKKIVGYSTKYARGPLKNFKNYFVIYVDKPITLAKVYSDSTLNDGLELSAKHASAVIGFKTAKGEKVNLRVASSFISIEQAEISLNREIGKDNFDITKKKAKAVWNKTLSKLAVEGGSVEQVKTFYSCLYRMLFFPNKMYELDAKNQPVHYSAQNGQILPGYNLQARVSGIPSGRYTRS
jgi:predicted alpha-1,2-mannosidase